MLIGPDFSLGNNSFVSSSMLIVFSGKADRSLKTKRIRVAGKADFLSEIVNRYE